MSILINGISIPDRPILIKILPNETAIVYDDEPYETDCFEIKPHGDLIDRDVLMQNAVEIIPQRVFDFVPVVIPAERSKDATD